MDFSYDQIPQNDQLLNRIMSPYNSVQAGFNDILRDKINSLKEKYNEEALSDFTQSNLLERMRKQQELDINDYKTNPQYKDALTRTQLGQANIQSAAGDKAQALKQSDIDTTLSNNLVTQKQNERHSEIQAIDDVLTNGYYGTVDPNDPTPPTPLSDNARNILKQRRQMLLEQSAYDEKEQKARWHDERARELWGDRLAATERAAAAHVPAGKDPVAEFNKLTPNKVVPIIEYALSKGVDPVTHEPLTEEALKAWNVRLNSAIEQAKAYAPTSAKEGSMDLGAQTNKAIKTMPSPIKPAGQPKSNVDALKALLNQ